MDNKHEVEFLNQLLSNLFVMYVKFHRYHWFIEGQHFFQLHEKFEEIYNLLAADIDEIAERILMINGKPYATMIKYLKEATIEEATADDTEEEIIEQIISDFKQINKEIYEKGIPYASKQHDEPTLDMLIGIQSKLEKYIWMFSAYKRDN